MVIRAILVIILTALALSADAALLLRGHSGVFGPTTPPGSGVCLATGTSATDCMATGTSATDVGAYQ